MDACIRRIHENRVTRPIKRAIVRTVAANNKSRAALNWYYNLLGSTAKSRFHARYAKIFRRSGMLLSPGEWTVRFAKNGIRLPLRRSWSWLDWDAAVSIVAHDIEVKQTYAALLSSGRRPALFVDIGASYGTHSILFLSAGVPIIAFEPNPACYTYFQSVCELNGFAGRWEQVAIGAALGESVLTYPDQETWLGSMSSEVIARLEQRDQLKRIEVHVKPLDDYLNYFPPGDVVMKIDVEGYECEVLEGASHVFRERKPILIFESNDVDSRQTLFKILSEFDYVIHPLPWFASGRSSTLDVDRFRASSESNFVAVPCRGAT